MKHTTFLLTATALAVAPLFAKEAAKASDPTTPVSRMEAKANQPGRGDGIFGEYWWANRFASRMAAAKAAKGQTVDVVMMGDSIMHFWEWKHPESWAKFTRGRKVINCGYGGDQTQQVLWRIAHGELDGYKAKAVVVMIGTNNNSADKSKPDAVAQGVEKVVEEVRRHQPHAKVILHPIFPRGHSGDSKRHAAARKRNDVTNALLAEWAKKHPEIAWVDFNAKLVDESGWVPKAIMADEIHPTDAGYELWMGALNPTLDKVCGAR